MRGRARTLLVLSGGHDALPAIEAAQRLGLSVVVCDGEPDAPGFRIADAGLLAPLDDPEAVVEAARAWAARHGITGVLAGVHVPRTLAAVVDALGLPGLPVEAGAALGDRLVLAARLREVGVPMPRGTLVSSVGVLAAYGACRSRSVVVRPVSGRRGAGVSSLHPGDDAAPAFAAAAATGGRVVAEELVPGPAVRLDLLVVDGRVLVVGWTDRWREGSGVGSSLHDVGRQMPTRLEPVSRRAVERLVGLAVGALGVRTGSLAAEVVLGPDGPVLVGLEVGLPDRWATIHEIPRATGVAFLDSAIALALGGGSPPALWPRSAGVVVRRCLRAGRGIVTEIRGLPEAQATEGVVLVEVDAVPGMVRRLPRDHRAVAGVVIAVGATAAEAGDRAARAAACVHIVTTPERQPVAAALS